MLKQARIQHVTKCLFVIIILITLPSFTFLAAYGEERSIRIYIEPLPEGAKHAQNVAYDATKFWSERDGVKFYQVFEKEQSDLMVKWVKEDSNFENELGYYYNGLISVALGDSSCGGIWQPYSSNTISATLKHEIGHALGYKHSLDPNDVMYHKVTSQYAEGSVCTQIQSLANAGIEFNWLVGAILVIVGAASMILISQSNRRTDYWRT